MWSFLSQHRSNKAYCKHAALTKTYSAGHLTKNRFNWDPGHPMVHLSFVGKWTTLSLMQLHHQSRSDLQVAYRLLLIIYALASNKCYDVCADTVLSFSGIARPPATAAASFLFQTINEGQLGYAWNLFRFMINRHIKHFCSNSSGFIWLGSFVCIQPFGSNSFVCPHTNSRPSSQYQTSTVYSLAESLK